MRQGMDFLISDGGQRRDDHVETIEPWPSLDVVKAQRADANHEGQRGGEEPEIAESPHRCCYRYRCAVITSSFRDYIVLTF